VKVLAQLGQNDQKCMKDCVSKGPGCKGIFIEAKTASSSSNCHMVMEKNGKVPAAATGGKEASAKDYNSAMKQCLSKGTACSGVFVAKGHADTHMVMTEKAGEGDKASNTAPSEDAFENSADPAIKDEEFHAHTGDTEGIQAQLMAAKTELLGDPWSNGL